MNRLSNFLDLAEEWVKATFTGEASFNTITSYPDGDPVKLLTSRLVVADALRRAIPSLDIVLTPNGFGIVSSSNIAPASKQRVDRLVGSMLANRDDCIASLLPRLKGVGHWLGSEQSEFFGSTLFPTLDIVDAIGPFIGSKWEKYLELHPKIFDLETSLAEDWFSSELMAALRAEFLRGTMTAQRKSVVLSIQTQVVEYLKRSSFNSRRLADTVNFIRQPVPYSRYQ